MKNEKNPIIHWNRAHNRNLNLNPYSPRASDFVFICWNVVPHVLYALVAVTAVGSLRASLTNLRYRMFSFWFVVKMWLIFGTRYKPFLDIVRLFHVRSSLSCSFWFQWSVTDETVELWVTKYCSICIEAYSNASTYQLILFVGIYNGIYATFLFIMKLTIVMLSWNIYADDDEEEYTTTTIVY